jgi:hypothetical protein
MQQGQECTESGGKQTTIRKRREKQKSENGGKGRKQKLAGKVENRKWREK